MPEQPPDLVAVLLECVARGLGIDVDELLDAVIAGLDPQRHEFAAALGRLAAAGLVTVGAAGRVDLTDDGATLLRSFGRAHGSSLRRKIDASVAAFPSVPGEPVEIDRERWTAAVARVQSRKRREIGRRIEIVEEILAGMRRSDEVSLTARNPATKSLEAERSYLLAALAAVDDAR